MGGAGPGYYDSSRGSTRTRSRSLDGSRRRSSQSVRRSDSSRRQISSKNVSRRKVDASKRKKEMEVLEVARTRQAGVQALGLFIPLLQAMSLCVVLATVGYFTVTDYTYLSKYFYVYVGSMLTEIILLVIALSLAYYYGTCLRWIFWLSYGSVLLWEGLLLWILLYRLHNAAIILKCERKVNARVCSAIDHIPSGLVFVLVHSFVLVAHSLIFILSFFWRVFYAGSMDHLKKSKRGRRLIKKYSRRSTSRRKYVTSTRRTASTKYSRSTLPPGTKSERDDSACQIVRKDGTKQLAVVSSSKSEIYTHSTRGCKKTVIKDKKVYAERGDGKVITSNIPKEISQQDIDCTHEKFIMMKGQLYPDLDHGPQKSTRNAETGTQSEKPSVVNESKDFSKSATDSLRPASRFNSITKMPALESSIAVLNKLEKKRQLDNKSRYAFQN